MAPTEAMPALSVTGVLRPRMFSTAEATAFLHDQLIRLAFDHVGGGLRAEGGDLKGFEIAGADGAQHEPRGPRSAFSRV